jgi:CheY-like chemotaxis protein
MVIAQTLSEFVGARTMSTILLVDDDVDSLWLLQIILEGRGHHILMAEGGEVALEKAGRYLPDLIVTDWNMPGVDGIALCERLKWYPALALIPVVMTSGQFPPKEKSTLWNVFLSKPVDPDALASTIDTLLARRLPNAPSRMNVPAPAPSRWHQYHQGFGCSWPSSSRRQKLTVEQSTIARSAHVTATHSLQRARRCWTDAP